MTLWLNKKEKAYLEVLMEENMCDFPDGNDILTEGERNKLYEKLKGCTP